MCSFRSLSPGLLREDPSNLVITYLVIDVVAGGSPMTSSMLIALNPASYPGTCIDLPGNLRTVGAKVRLNDCNSVPGQAFKIDAQGDKRNGMDKDEDGCRRTLHEVARSRCGLHLLCGGEGWRMFM